MLVAVYGTLKGGYGNNYLLKNSKLISEEVIVGFEMYSVGGFPVIYKKEGCPITIEVYEVSEDILTGSLDALEGHPHWYCRELVETSEGEAWLYVMTDERYKDPSRLIESGEF